MHSLPFSSPAFHVVQHHLSLGQHERDLNFPNIWAAFEHVKSSRPLKTMTNLGINHYISCHSCTQCILLENYSKICWLVKFNLKKKIIQKTFKIQYSHEVKKYYARAIFVEFKVKFCTHFETNLDSVTSYWMRYNLAWQCIFSRSLIRFHRGFFTVSFRSMFYKYLLI